jgi:hypothetical protein
MYNNLCESYSRLGLEKNLTLLTQPCKRKLPYNGPTIYQQSQSTRRGAGSK